jgi:hypothetical protein
MGKVAERLAIHADSMSGQPKSMPALARYKGIVTYADGTTLNLFTTFGVSQAAEVDFDLDNANPASGALRKACAGDVRTIAGNLDGVPFAGVHLDLRRRVL